MTESQWVEALRWAKALMEDIDLGGGDVVQDPDPGQARAQRTDRDAGRGAGLGQAPADLLRDRRMEKVGHSGHSKA